MTSDTMQTPREPTTQDQALVNAYAQFPFTIESGRGARVRDTNGREYWDLYGGHAVAILGHCHPSIAEAIRIQAETLLFYSNAAPLENRTRAAERLCAFAGGGLDRVFFCNSGAEANENALKLAMQLTGRRKIAALAGGFHGRTLLALSATDNAALREPIADVLCPTAFLQPNDVASLTMIDEQTAALIVEPIQSMAGVVELTPEFLRAIRARCAEVGALLIYDEVQTGMGRTGRPFVTGEHDVFPDMATSAKGLANGVPIGALLMSAAVGERLRLGDLGSTFGGGPVASAALLATIEAIEREGLLNKAVVFEAHARRVLVSGPVKAVRGRGCLLGLEVRGNAKGLQARLLARGFIVGTSRDPGVLRLLPPLNTPLEALDELATALHGMGGAA